MGRYYNGDIEGKFWFGLQSSNCADRFGVMGTQPNYLEYHFDDDQLEYVFEELLSIKKDLGANFDIIDKWYNAERLISFEELVKELNVDKKEAKRMTSEYADYLIGIQIKEKLEETGECSFTAEF